MSVTDNFLTQKKWGISMNVLMCNNTRNEIEGEGEERLSQNMYCYQKGYEDAIEIIKNVLNKVLIEDT